MSENALSKHQLDALSRVVRLTTGFATPEQRQKSLQTYFSTLREVLLGLGFPDSEIRNAGARFFAEAGHRLPVQNTPSDP